MIATQATSFIVPERKDEKVERGKWKEAGRRPFDPTDGGSQDRREGRR
jgi:hypothetical protein